MSSKVNRPAVKGSNTTRKAYSYLYISIYLSLLEARTSR